MTTYNGWANRETWLVNLWFGDYFAELADGGEVIDADYIRDFVDEHVAECMGGGRDGFIADMLDMSGIDWGELAEHYAPADADEVDQ